MHQIIINDTIRTVTIVRDLPKLSEGGHRDWCKVQTSDGRQLVVRRSQLSEPPSDNGEEIEVHAYPIDSKRVLRKGQRFRPIAGSGPRYHGEPNGETGRFVCLRIWRRGDKLYCYARNEKRGGVYTLYLDGPAYETNVGSIMYPYRLKLVK